MQAHSLVPLFSPTGLQPTDHPGAANTVEFSIPIAQLRSVYHTDEVERRLTKLQKSGDAKEHEGLRSTYQRMLELGPDRFQVKPNGVPHMASLYEQLPNFTEVLDDVKRYVAKCAHPLEKVKRADFPSETEDLRPKT